MVKTVIKYIVVILTIAMAGCAPAISGAAKKYITHLNKLHEIIVKHKHNTDKAAIEAAEYVNKNKDDIEAVLTNLKDMNIKEVGKNKKAVIEPVNRIKTAVTGDPPVYPDAFRLDIIKLLENNNAELEKEIQAIRTKDEFFLHSYFAKITVRLKWIKNINKEYPLKAFNIKYNAEFSAALKTLKIDNLVM